MYVPAEYHCLLPAIPLLHLYDLVQPSLCQFLLVKFQNILPSRSPVKSELTQI